jgi:nitrate reductase gamma subunit
VEELALAIVAGFVAIIAVVIGAVALFERRQRRRVEALGRRRKDRIRL